MEFEAEQADEVVAWLSGADAGGSDAPAGSIPHAPLYNQGLICAGCHLRNYQVYGPPGNEALPPLEPDVRLPHDGGQTRDAFESSRFCAACHQFEPDEYALNGKLFENTFEEWKASPQAKEGKSCQSCHMPGRRHLWRGIHDKVTVQSGVGITLNEVVTGNNRISGVLTLSNTGVGHRFPTYITPRVVLEANGRGEIHVNRELETGVRGVFAAGDVNDGREKQVVVAAGEGARAALAAFSYLVHQV